MNRLKLRLISILICLTCIVISTPQNTYALELSNGNSTSLSSGTTGTLTKILSDRIAGKDRYETSVGISQLGWNKSYFAILASGENFPDALCAAPLVSKYNAPILLTSTDSLKSNTKDELLRLNVKNVLMIGGEGVLSTKVEQSIKDLGIEVTRIAGQDRYETSLKVAKLLGNPEKAIISSGKDFPDVLSIASIAANKGIPILFTSQNNLSKELKAYISQSIQKTYILDDDSRISDSVVNQLPAAERLTGLNRYESNIKIINTFKNDLDFSTCYVATGEDYPDALSGSALASLTKSPVIFVNEPLKHDTINFVMSIKSNIKKIIAFGGSGAVSDKTIDEIIATNEETSGGLSVPVNISAKTISSNQIYLTWDSVNTATSYYIYRATSFSGTYSYVTEVSTPYYSDTYLPPGITYYYKVQAVNPIGKSLYSNIASASTNSGNALLPPTNISATPLSSNEIYLTWDTVNNAVTYNVYRTNANSSFFTLIDSVNTNYYTDTTATEGSIYYYKIQAAAPGETGPYSSSVSVTALLAKSTLSNPTNVLLTSSGSNQLYLSWNPVSNANYYNVYRATSYSGTYTNIASVAFPYYTDRNVTSGTIYYYKVQSVNNTGSSAYSNIVYAIPSQ